MQDIAPVSGTLSKKPVVIEMKPDHQNNQIFRCKLMEQMLPEIIIFFIFIHSRFTTVFTNFFYFFLLLKSVFTTRSGDFFSSDIHNQEEWKLWVFRTNSWKVTILLEFKLKHDSLSFIHSYSRPFILYRVKKGLEPIPRVHPGPPIHDRAHILWAILEYQL